ncbi:PLC-like phosphodiesterase [Serendipita vermifera]|nr:PLC-like phosphodiesterase [Serendipita vermifera]
MQLLSTLSISSVLVSLVAAALDPATVDAHLAAAANLLGTFEESSDSISNWMSTLDDSTTLQSLSIPGTHDSLTWNVTGLAASFTKTQDISLFQQLDAGVRFIDLRIGETNGMVQLYHGSVLLDQTAQLVDVFYGLYKWLDAHTSETIIVSVKVDEGQNTVTLQQSVYDAVTGTDVADYWVQGTTFPTLGAARHKAVLLRRFALDQLPELTPIGIEASGGWTDNNAAFSIPYNGNVDTLYIEDFYDVGTTDIPSAVDAKFAAVSAHLDLATGSDLASQFFITFASGYSGISVTPQAMAVGNGTAVPGVNSKVLNYLAGKRGSRFGVIMFDFIGSDTRLAPATLSQEVDLAATPSSLSTPTTTFTSTPLNGGAFTSSSLPHPVILFTLVASFTSLLGFLVV